MCSGKAAHAPRFVRCQSIRQRPPAMGTQNSCFSGGSPRVLVEHACPFVEAPRVPRVHKAELLEIEMMAKFVAEGAQECTERGDFLANRRPHPHANQRGVWCVVAKKFEHSMFTSS